MLISSYEEDSSLHEGLDCRSAPETQLYDLRQMAEQRAIEIVEEYTDRISGAKAKRPGLDALMRDARRGRFDVVLVWASDRIARSVKHFLEVLDELSRLNIEFVSFREQIDTGGPLGRAVVVIVGAIAELERNLIVERVRAGMRRARLEGRHIGRKPLDLDRVRSSANGSKVRAGPVGEGLTLYPAPPSTVCSTSAPQPLRSDNDEASEPREERLLPSLSKDRVAEPGGSRTGSRSAEGKTERQEGLPPRLVSLPCRMWMACRSQLPARLGPSLCRRTQMTTTDPSLHLISAVTKALQKSAPKTPVKSGPLTPLLAVSKPVPYGTGEHTSYRTLGGKPSVNAFSIRVA